jgi:hypothetical protein
MHYQRPTVESRQSIEQPFVLGGYFTPTWTDEAGEGDPNP